MKKWLIALFLVLPIVHAEVFVANTAEWTDLYSTGMYATLTGHDFLFLTSPKHSEALPLEIPKGSAVTVVETTKIPFVRNYADRLRRLGYNADNLTLPETSVNLALAEKVGLTRFIVIDPTYGYDAITIAPYAVMTHQYVLFATAENLPTVTSFLDRHKVDSVTLFGDIENAVRDALAAYHPETIDVGNHYQNNIAIAQKLQTLGATDQAILSNGEFLEHDIFYAGNNKQPVIYIGRNTPPQETLNYLGGAPYKTHVVLGNDLINSAQVIKRSVNKPLFIKFGKGITGDTTYKPVEGLDLFKVPIIDLLLRLRGLTYNTDTGQLELAIENAKNARTYLRPSVLVRSEGKPVQNLGEDAIGALARQETHTYAYAAELQAYLDTNLSAQVFIPYGAYDNTLDFAITEDLPITIVNNAARCSLDITDAVYDSATQRIQVTLRADKPCHAQVTLQDVIVSGQQKNVQSDEQSIEGESAIEVKQTLDQVDLADNKEITIKAAFGTRPGALTQFTSKTLPLRRSSTIPWMPIITILMALITIATLLWRQKKR